MQTNITAQASILEILEEEQRICDRMVVVAEAKQTALIHADVEALVPLVREMESLAAALDQVEASRLAQIAALTGRTDTSATSWREMAPLFDAAGNSRLVHLRESLLSAQERLRYLNSGNATLVGQAIELTDALLRLVRGALAGTYAAGGSFQAAPQTARRWSA